MQIGSCNDNDYEGMIPFQKRDETLSLKRRLRKNNIQRVRQKQAVKREVWITEALFEYSFTTYTLLNATVRHRACLP